MFLLSEYWQLRIFTMCNDHHMLNVIYTVDGHSPEWFIHLYSLCNLTLSTLTVKVKMKFLSGELYLWHPIYKSKPSWYCTLQVMNMWWTKPRSWVRLNYASNTKFFLVCFCSHHMKEVMFYSAVNTNIASLPAKSMQTDILQSIWILRS